MNEIQFANLVAKFSTVLSVGISDVATSMVLESIVTRDGDPLDEGLYAFVIDRGLENEEFVIGTLAETGVFTFLVRGVSYIDGATSIPANIFSHRKGATIEITAHPVLTELVDRFTDFFNTYNGKWSGAVADYASLPEGQNDGEARITLDDSKIYVWSAAEESWKLSGAGGAGGTVYVTHKLGSESVGGDMKTFVLDSGSFPLDKFLQVYLNGTLQELATDYTTSNNNTIIFENEVEATDKITMLVVSVSLVALGGVLTQDVIPDADEAYNIGSDEYKVNEIHAKELNAANIIDPDNPVAQSPAKLIGGTDVVLSNFTTLGAGTNDGAFKATIDGVEYDNISIDLIIPDTSSIESLSHSSSFPSFTMNEKAKIINIVVGVHTANLGSSYKLVIHENDISGDIVAESIPFITSNTLNKTATFSGENIVEYQNGSQYYIEFVRTDGPGGSVFNQIVSVNGYQYRVINSTEEIATQVQSAIRTATSKLETVVWDTDHFEITSTISGKNNGSQMLRFDAPTIGTDISGAGYLDLGANATEVPSDGDDYKLVRLDSNGQIPVEIFNNLSNTVFDDIDTTAKSLNTVYQNTTDKNKLVIVSVYFHITVGADSTSVGQIGETNNPTTVVSTARIKGGSYPDSGTIPVFMLVKPGWYYRVSGGTSVASWFECDLI